jgi:hypothetical protein
MPRNNWTREELILTFNLYLSNCYEITCLFNYKYVPFGHERYRVNIKSA